MRRITMQAVRSDSSKDKISDLKDNFLLAYASMNTAAVPMLPASVGENHPAMSPPMTREKIIATHRNSGEDFILSSHVDLGDGLATDGSILTQPMITHMKNRAMISPGKIPARKSFPIDCSVMIP